MTRIERSIDIQAPPQAVFTELTDLHRLDRWSTITASHEGPGRTLQSGDEFNQTIRVAGVSLPSEWRCVDCDPPNRVVYEATAPGGGRLHMEQVVVATGTTSRMELTVDYDLPGGLLGDILDRLYVERRNEREAEHSLENLKDLVESQHSDRSDNPRGTT